MKYSIRFWVFLIPLVLGKDELCTDLPVKVQLYKGSPPNGDLFSGKMVEDIFKGLAEGLASAFQKHDQNYTFPDFNISSVDYGDAPVAPQPADEDGPHLPSESDFDEKSAPPILHGDDRAMDQPQPAIAKSPNLGIKFALPNFVKNALPSVVINKNTTHDLEEKLAGHPVEGPGPLEALGVADAENLTLDTWGISLPVNTIKAEIAKIDGDAVREIATLDHVTFGDANKTTNETAKFLRHVSLADFDVKDKDVLIVCLSLAIVKNDKQVACQRCLLIRACQEFDTECGQKFLTFRASDSQVQARSVSLQYFVDQPPLHGMKIVTKLTAKSDDQRCEPSADDKDAHSVLEKSGTLFPETVTYLDVPNLSPKYAYGVQVDLNVNFNDKHYKQPYHWPNPVVIQDYLESKEQPFVINACGSGKK